MQLEKQVCSLELSKKLKELGVKQESLFYWVHDDLTSTYLATEKQLPIIQAGYNRIPHQSMAEDYGWRENVEKCSAFTVAELGEMLKGEFDSGVRKEHSFCEYFKSDGEQLIEEADTEADARAKMLVYLIENKLITL